LRATVSQENTSALTTTTLALSNGLFLGLLGLSLLDTLALFHELLELALLQSLVVGQVEFLVRANVLGTEHPSALL
jgi:hypothetical protein